MVATSQREALMARLTAWSEAWEEALSAWQALCAADGAHELALVMISGDACKALRAALPRPPGGAAP